MSALPSAVETDLRMIGGPAPRRSRLSDYELSVWTRSVRLLLESTDVLLDRLEQLNLEGQRRAPQPLRDFTAALLEAAHVARRDHTVQGLLDGVFDLQECILLELRECRREYRRRARLWRLARAAKWRFG